MAFEDLHKTLRGNFFRKFPILSLRKEIGAELFDLKFRYLHKFISEQVRIGDTFHFGKVAERFKVERYQFHLMLLLYNNVDFFVRNTKDMLLSVKGEVRQEIPFSGLRVFRQGELYRCPNMYDKILKSPKIYGVRPEDIVINK